MMFRRINLSVYARNNLNVNYISVDINFYILNELKLL